MKTPIIILFLCLSINTIAQDSTYYKYNDLRKKAEYCSDHNERKKAISLYDSSFQIIDAVPYMYFTAFSVAINDSNYEKANEYLIKGALKGLDLSSWYSPEIDLFNRTNYAKDYWKKKDSLLAIHLKSIDTEYYNALLEMKKLDQSIRDPENKKTFYNDSLNFEKLILLSTEKGFPTYKKTGEGCNIAGLLLWHHRDSFPNSNQWQRIIPLIKKEIAKGTFDPEYFKKFAETILKN